MTGPTLTVGTVVTGWPGSLPNEAARIESLTPATVTIRVHGYPLTFARAEVRAA